MHLVNCLRKWSLVLLVFAVMGWAAPLAATVVEVSMEATDLQGKPITYVRMGQDFLLKARVKDARRTATGVFGAYFNVTYPPTLAEGKVLIRTTGNFPVRTRGTLSSGKIEGAGGVGGTTPPSPVNGVYEVIRVRMTAKRRGLLSFQIGPASGVGESQLLVYQSNTALPPVFHSVHPSIPHDLLTLGIRCSLHKGDSKRRKMRE